MNNILKILLIFFSLCLTASAQVVKDEVADSLPRDIKLVETHTNYNYKSTYKIPLKLKPIDFIKSEKELQEGDIIKFRVIEDIIFRRDAIIEANSIITAKVSTIITPGMNGIPASVILTDFKCDYENFKGVFSGSYEYTGKDRTLWVYPLKWALTPLPPTGTLTNFIKGGHVKINPAKTIKIYYYPEWI